ncbi:MlaD family protein [Nocardioides plantarum]|uniref:MlaD family protein n=1 Tax=Nocardioides plantarum TaxID=29299 RepID=A0ABV5KCQ1_9ACTN|nr:MlaD family protein [Nocardioides plantarum]
MTRLRTIAVTVTLAVLCTVLGGCSQLTGGASELPLPGGADVGDHPYELTAEFGDALDLVPRSAVQVDNVPVGVVTEIGLNADGTGAMVTMQLNGDVVLPVGSTARIQQTTLLGEKYVAIVRPEGTEGTEGTEGSGGSGGSGGAAGLLGDGAVLPLASTSQAVGVEQVLGALSLLLNGGGIGQFQEISRELQKVGGGRTDEIRAFLRETRTFVASLDDHSDDIVLALDGLDRLGKALRADRGKIVTALEDVEPGLAVLADQRTDLVRMLRALDRLSTVTVRTLEASQDDIVADLDLLTPILRELADAGSDLPRALEILLTYPFPDSVLPAVQGDYLNAFIATAYRTPGGTWPQVSLWPLDGAVGTTRDGLRQIGPPPLMLPSDGGTTTDPDGSPGGSTEPPATVPPTTGPTAPSATQSPTDPATTAPSTTAPSTTSPSTTSPSTTAPPSQSPAPTTPEPTAAGRATRRR